MTLIYQIYKINTCNYHKKSSFNCFQAYFFKTNVYNYSRHSSIKYIQYIHATTTKKLVSRLLMLISRKPMFITAIDTYLSNIYNKYMQLQQKKLFQAKFLKTNVDHYSLDTHLSNIYNKSCNYQKKTSFMSFHASFLKTNVYYYYSDSSINISINSCNYHKSISFKSFHPNF